jgi:DNA-binding MarR family transcriptional regulator/N-acetylglutamate synthase-like GNAT family acetyltransferase
MISDMSQMIDRGAVARVRRFNRTTAERIGALADDYLGRKRPLGQARLLWEIGLEGARIRDLRARLGLDSGYVSRLLRALERDGLVHVDGDSADGRVRRATLTELGVEEWRELDARSDALARSFLEPLSPSQRRALVEAMGTVERLLTASLISIGIEDPRGEAARWCLAQYFDELRVRFEGGFDPGRSLVARDAELTLPAGLLLVARLRGKAVGCAGLKLHGRGPADIKHMWVAPSVRRLGLGRRILAELERQARERGATAVRLETNRALTEAISLYRRSGYREIAAFNDEPYAHHWFEKRL